MKKSLLLSVSAILVLSLVGCGSSDDDNTTSSQSVTAQFVDAEVSGLGYKCSADAEVSLTNAKGEFTCKSGDEVTFLVGEYKLGSVTLTTSTEIVMPEDLYPDSEEAELNVAQLLQSIDTDASDDIITIDDAYDALDELNTTVQESDFEKDVEEILKITLVTEAEAQAHLDAVKAEIEKAKNDAVDAAVELSELLVGTTQYSININKVETERTFNADGTYTGTVELDGKEPFEVTGTYEVKDGVLEMTREASEASAEASFVVTYKSDEAGEIEFSASKDGGDAFDTYFYTSKEDRDNKIEELFDTVISITN